MQHVDYSFKRNKADYILSITAFLQSLLSLVQNFMLSVLHMPEPVAAQFRVLATAAPILICMCIVLKRKPIQTLGVYTLVFFVALVTITIWPERWQYMSDDFTKFTLAVVVPTGLIAASVEKVHIFIKSAIFVAIASSFFAIVYAYYIIRGTFSIEGYDMALSYSLLLPTVVLLTQEKIYYWIGALCMLFVIFSVGSRGAFGTILLFGLVRYFWGKVSVSKFIIYVLILFIFFELLFTPFVEFISDILDAANVNSRTLKLLVDGEFVSHESGRDDLSKMAWNLIDRNPFTGNGVWADRQYMGIYCHNIILELLLDFGYIVTGIITLVFCGNVYVTFMPLASNHKLYFLMFMMSILIPMFVSGSYLIDYNIGLLIGIIALYKRNSSLLSKS